MEKKLIKDLSDREILEILMFEIKNIHEHLNWLMKEKVVNKN